MAKQLRHHQKDGGVFGKTKCLMSNYDPASPHANSGATDKAKFTVVKVDTIKASAPVADNSPQLFDGHKTDFGDPCAASSPGQALIIFYDEVVDANHQIQDFDVTLKANVLPASVTASQLNESWVKVKGPSSGSLNRTDTFEVKYQNPKVGGLYQFEFDLGADGSAKSGANVLLPLAGADITGWLQNEAAYVAEWGASHKAATQATNASPIIGMARYRTFKTWMKLSGRAFDYAIIPVSEDGSAPCLRFNAPDVANRIYVTVNGVVVHGSKINNLLWGIFGSGWGFGENALKSGAMANEFWEKLQPDPPSSQNAIHLGCIIFNAPVAPITDILTPTAVQTMQIPEDDIGSRLWPSAEPASVGKSTLERPVLPYKP